MNKKALTEADIRTKFITPALDKDKQGSWDLMTQLLEEYYFTKGRVIVRGQTVHRGEAKKADYLMDVDEQLVEAMVRVAQAVEQRVATLIEA